MSTGVARSTDGPYQAALEQYTAAMKLYSQQKFERAKPLLEKLCDSPYRELAERARTHYEACEGRLGKFSAPPQSGDELYQHAVVRMNAGQFDQAEELLTKAMRAGNMAPHVHYAMACLRAQMHDTDAALTCLKEAIRGDGRCRTQARQDNDFDALMDDPRFTEILYPEAHS